MSDPLAEIIAMLKPRAPFSKLVQASGRWQVNRIEVEKVFYSMILKGSARLEVAEKSPVIFGAGDFVLVPAAFNFSLSSLEPPRPADEQTAPVINADGVAHLGPSDRPIEMQALVGYCELGSPDAALLVSLLPDIIAVRGEDRLGTLTKLVASEARAERPAREVVLEHLLQVLMIEALRSSSETTAMPGLLRGLADERIAVALRTMHAKPDRNWTMAELARAAGLSRSAFFARFSRTVGVPPMDYFLAWRMTIAKDLLRGGRKSVSEVATQIGYGSASAFSMAFSRLVGQPPGHYARQMAAADSV